MTPEIRPAVETDLDAIHRIYAYEAEHGTSTYEYDVPSLLTLGDRWRAIIDAGYPYRVAELDGHVVGYAYASAYRAREGYRWTVENSVYVDDAARERGVGRALLTALIDDCTALGYRQMIAVVGDAMNTASIALHERLGFRVVARFPGIGRKHGRWLESVQLLRALGAGDRTAPETSPLPDRR
ncbi:N-acetyltransferase [Lysobacter sp. TY2-98]|uniref:GNAT family N-acetyltransferase n=1 Tax=Lysobacter sp. TY2-98 TaxID=2290922 RepID=UPI000E209B63|nr:GNAT family N-acetyltransferase [Lysobacter sp. TY2-98]AXK71706.1 N-acetyltransferase [Lysobacter sp. TY2-98]